MIYVLENDKFEVKISSIGAELKSMFSKKTNFEYVWQGHKDYWTGSACNLFPICGRLFEQKYTYKGKEYSMPPHGFVRNMEFIMEEKTNTKIVLRVDSDSETLKMYPFNFTFKIIYTLIGSTLKNEFYVENNEEEILPFSVGGHPGFNIPFEKGLTLNDHYIEFEKAKNRLQVEFSPTCFCTGKTLEFKMEDDKIINLDYKLFENDAIFLEDDNGTVSIKSKKSNKCVSLSYNNASHVGFWQNYTKNTPFVCIEPWYGIPSTDGIVDDLDSKNKLIYLKKGENYNFCFDISITE